jgi:hypothetical protein
MHLDPDFVYLTYGDQGERAKQIRQHLHESKGDLIVFYAALRDVHAESTGLVYAIIGVLVVERLVRAAEVAEQERDHNAHSRRVLDPSASDVIVLGRSDASGRLRRGLPIGEYRDRAYRVRTELLASWGELSVRNGYLQRSARLPRFLNPPSFIRWFEAQDVELQQANN